MARRAGLAPHALGVAELRDELERRSRRPVVSPLQIALQWLVHGSSSEGGRQLQDWMAVASAPQQGRASRLQFAIRWLDLRQPPGVGEPSSPGHGSSSGVRAIPVQAVFALNVSHTA